MGGVGVAAPSQVWLINTPALVKPSFTPAALGPAGRFGSVQPWSSVAVSDGVLGQLSRSSGTRAASASPLQYAAPQVGSAPARRSFRVRSREIQMYWDGVNRLAIICLAAVRMSKLAVATRLT